MTSPQATPYVEHASVDAFVPTLAKIEAAISAAGMTIFARIDHAAGARSVGLEMPPTIVLIYGNPRGGTPIMLAAPQAALDLPLRVLVREAADGKTIVSFHPMATVLREADVPEDLATRLDPAQSLLLKSIRTGQAG